MEPHPGELEYMGVQIFYEGDYVLSFVPAPVALDQLQHLLGSPHDGASSAQPLGTHVHLDDTSQFSPPGLQVALTETQEAINEEPVSSSAPRCETCNKVFGRPQELKRHGNEVHKLQQRICPFKSCTYKWKRPDKIRAHIIDVHNSELCPVVIQGLRALHRKPEGVVKFVNAYEFGYSFKPPAEPYVSPPGPPLEPFEKFGLREYCGCDLKSADVFSSEDVVEQTVEEGTMLLEGQSRMEGVQ
ncbi:hypothetical protein EDB87DRAFT_164377 [Lactarius vividus]|nr:hypothetical protein EDB87DRAFT_164377 [Lactarius vividus]